MSAEDLMLKPVQELAAHVRGGEIAAREVVSAALARIDDLDERINAFVEVDAERALEAADTIQPGDERPFAGVPIAIKSNVPVAGMCMNFGSKFLSHTPPGSQRVPGPPAARRGLRGGRDHEHAGVRDPAHHRAAPQRRDP